MKGWRPDADLSRLLTALGKEIADIPDEDVRMLCGQAGTPISGIARDMRARIAAVNDDDAELRSTLADIIHSHEACFRSN